MLWDPRFFVMSTISGGWVLPAVVTFTFFCFVLLVFIGIDDTTVVLLLALAALREMGRYVLGMFPWSRELLSGCYILDEPSIDWFKLFILL